MRKWLTGWVGACVCAVVLCVAPSDGQEKKSPPQVKPDVWMKRKLEFSQEILAGLTEGNFAKVNDFAQMLNFVGYLSAWLRAEEPDYKRQVTYFEFAAKELIRQSKEKNIDGAMLAYNQLTTSCVQCHKVVRAGKK